jgi:hypothetical protein
VYTLPITKAGNNGSTYDVTVQSGAFHDLANNPNIANSQTGLKPAGVAGEAVNLGLTDATGHDGVVTLTFTGSPSDWTLNGGTHHVDGSWTVATNDVGSLTVTTPSTYTGALLNVSEPGPTPTAASDTQPSSATSSLCGRLPDLRVIR